MEEVKEVALAPLKLRLTMLPVSKAMPYPFKLKSDLTSIVSPLSKPWVPPLPSLLLFFSVNTLFSASRTIVLVPSLRVNLAGFVPSASVKLSKDQAKRCKSKIKVFKVFTPLLVEVV